MSYKIVVLCHTNEIFYLQKCVDFWVDDSDEKEIELKGVACVGSCQCLTVRESLVLEFMKTLRETVATQFILQLV